MGKGSFIAMVALLIAVAGAIVAFAAYFRHRNCILCGDIDDGIDDDMSDLDYYATHLDSDDLPAFDDDDAGYPEADVTPISSVKPQETQEPEA